MHDILGAGASRTGAGQIADRIEEHAGTAIFTALRIIADHTKADVRTGLEQELPAQEIAITVVDIRFAGCGLLHKAVALHVYAFKLCRQLVADERPGHATFEPQIIIVAVCRGAIGTKIETRLLRDDVEQAGTGIAPEQRALRAAQHFNTLHLAEFRKADAGATAIDTVDEEGD